jgi:anti-sigma-K factor RskA
MNSRAPRHWREVVAVTAIVAASAVCAPDATAQKNQGSPNGAPYAISERLPLPAGRRLVAC